MGYAHYLLWLYPITFTLVVIWTWWLDARLYKGNLWHAVKGTYSAATSSRAKFFLWASMLLIVGAVLSYISFGREFLLPVCSYISTAVTTVTWVVRPPGVVLLASSQSQKARQLARSLAWTAMGYRVLYFLDPRSRHALGTVQLNSIEGGIGDLMNNRFLRADGKWSNTVFTLLEFVPVIVIDARRLSDGLQFEMQLISSSPSLLSKTFVIVDGRSEVVVAGYPQIAGRVIRSPDLPKAVVFALSHWKRRSLVSSAESKPRLLSQIPQCYRCGTPMRVITGNIIYRKDVRTQGCFQCRGCARLTCYDCSDNRVPCECEQKQWVARMYFLD